MVVVFRTVAHIPRARTSVVPGIYLLIYSYVYTCLLTYLSLLPFFVPPVPVRGVMALLNFLPVPIFLPTCIYLGVGGSGRLAEKRERSMIAHVMMD